MHVVKTTVRPALVWTRPRRSDSGCELVRTAGSHRHYSNPFRPDRLITFAWHPGDVPRGIIADIVEDLGITRDEFCFGKF